MGITSSNLSKLAVWITCVVTANPDFFGDEEEQPAKAHKKNIKSGSDENYDSESECKSPPYDKNNTSSPDYTHVRHPEDQNPGHFWPTVKSEPLSVNGLPPHSHELHHGFDGAANSYTLDCYQPPPAPSSSNFYSTEPLQQYDLSVDARAYRRGRNGQLTPIDPDPVALDNLLKEKELYDKLKEKDKSDPAGCKEKWDDHSARHERQLQETFTPNKPRKVTDAPTRNRKTLQDPVISKHFDIAIVYDKEDFLAVQYFISFVIELASKSGLEEPRIELHDSEHFPSSEIEAVEDIVKRSSIILLYLTPNFREERLQLFSSEAIGLTRLGHSHPDLAAGRAYNDKKWIVRPVHTMHPTIRTYKTPVGLTTTTGIDWYDQNSPHLLHKVEDMTKKAIEKRKEREIEEALSVRYAQLFNGNSGSQELQQSHVNPNERDVFRDRSSVEATSRRVQNSMSLSQHNGHAQTQTRKHHPKMVDNNSNPAVSRAAYSSYVLPKQVPSGGQSVTNRCQNSEKNVVNSTRGNGRSTQPSVLDPTSLASGMYQEPGQFEQVPQTNPVSGYTGFILQRHPASVPVGYLEQNVQDPQAPYNASYPMNIPQKQTMAWTSTSNWQAPAAQSSGQVVYQNGSGERFHSEPHMDQFPSMHHVQVNSLPMSGGYQHFIQQRVPLQTNLGPQSLQLVPDQQGQIFRHVTDSRYPQKQTFTPPQAMGGSRVPLSTNPGRGNPNYPSQSFPQRIETQASSINAVNHAPQRSSNIPSYQSIPRIPLNVNSDLSTGDLEIDQTGGSSYQHFESGKISPPSKPGSKTNTETSPDHRRKRRRGKSRSMSRELEHHHHFRFSSEDEDEFRSESDDTEDDDFFPKGRRNVTVSGCKIVQLGNGNKVIENAVLPKGQRKPKKTPKSKSENTSSKKTYAKEKLEEPAGVFETKMIETDLETTRSDTLVHPQITSQDSRICNSTIHEDNMSASYKRMDTRRNSKDLSSLMQPTTSTVLDELQICLKESNLTRQDSTSSDENNESPTSKTHSSSPFTSTELLPECENLSCCTSPDSDNTSLLPCRSSSPEFHSMFFSKSIFHPTSVLMTSLSNRITKEQLCASSSRHYDSEEELD